MLEAITEIPFPRKDNLCTRFATEIILCRASTPSITTKIIADRRRPASEQSKLEAFRLSISKFDELPELIDKATELMGLGQQESGAAGGVTKAFAKDVLSIQIAGPDRPQLTLVDLPGLIHAENKTQTADDVQVVSDLVQEYISNPRTIILAVVSAKNDYANQIILKRAREVDTKGIRTLGIITKPDFLYQGSESETAFISLAKNEDIYFTLGWHVLKNLGYDERKCTFSQRNRKEESFFSKGEWAKLSPEMLGIESLRTRLSDLLFAHIKEELPALKQELEKAHADTRASLDLLGASRKSTTEQREYLMDLSLQFYNLTKAAVGGHYDAEFFSKLDAVVSPGSPSDARRLRAIVKYFSMRFSNTMQKFGGKYAFDGDQNPGIAEPDGSDDGDGDTSKSINIIGDMICRKPMPLTNDEAFEWVKRVLVRTRGQELPGNFNPLIISELFWEQSENWFSMGISHMEKVATQCEEFVALALEEISPADVSSRLQAYRTDDELAKRLEAAREEFQKILGDMKRHPITYNHNYTLAIQKMRSTQKNTSLKSSLAAITTLQRDDGSLDIDGIVAGVHDKLQPDMDKHSCNDALSCLKAFYMVRCTLPVE